jgi:predicted GNAT family acetyltransferase
MADEWEVRHDERGRRFEVALGDERGVLNYHVDGQAFVITHTGVPRAWEGRGIAASLTRAACEYARRAGLAIVPVCSYAAAYLRRHPEYQDLRARD